MIPPWRPEPTLEMLWHDAAPSYVAEEILRGCHRKSIIPATIFPDKSRRGADKSKFAAHLKANGVGKYFSVDEIVAPNDKAKAASVGYTELVPPTHTWGLSTLLVWIADQIRHEVGSPVAMRNMWRPQSYNALVSSSSINSDHPNACSIDLDFADYLDRGGAETWLAEWIVSNDNAARVSVGLGERSLHIGVLSPEGSRWWKYKSYLGEVNPVFKHMKMMGVLGVSSDE